MFSDISSQIGLSELGQKLMTKQLGGKVLKFVKIAFDQHCSMLKFIKLS